MIHPELQSSSRFLNSRTSYQLALRLPSSLRGDSRKLFTVTIIIDRSRHISPAFPPPPLFRGCNIAGHNFATCRRIVAPKREKLQAALDSLRQKEAALEEAMQQLRNLHEKLGRLQQMYDARMKEKEDLIRLASTLVFLALWSAGNGLV